MFAGVVSGEEWHRFFSQFRGDFLVGGDFNAHHYLWDNCTPCPEGIKLADVISNLNIQCLNNNTLSR